MRGILCVICHLLVHFYPDAFNRENIRYLLYEKLLFIQSGFSCYLQVFFDNLTINNYPAFSCPVSVRAVLFYPGDPVLFARLYVMIVSTDSVMLLKSMVVEVQGPAGFRYHNMSDPGRPIIMISRFKFYVLYFHKQHTLPNEMISDDSEIPAQHASHRQT